jgi:hypothetical protein
MRLLQCFMIMKKILVTFDLVSTTVMKSTIVTVIPLLFLLLKLQKIIKNSFVSKKFSKKISMDSS